jgi:hypothetical protein
MDNFKTRIINFIESYLKKHVKNETAIWDYYILDFDEDFEFINVYYHTWEGNDVVKYYTPHFIKIPYTPIKD